MRGMAALLLWVLAVGGSTAATPEPRLTSQGWGELRIGMREAAAVRRFGLIVDQGDGPECRILRFPHRADLMVMAQSGRVASLILFGPSRLKTDRGLGIGAREAEVRRAYAGRLKVEPNVYDDPPARNLTFWVRPEKQGVMYETDKRGRVMAIHAGDETITWTDGCG